MFVVLKRSIVPGEKYIILSEPKKIPLSTLPEGVVDILKDFSIDGEFLGWVKGDKILAVSPVKIFLKKSLPTADIKGVYVLKAIKTTGGNDVLILEKTGELANVEFFVEISLDEEKCAVKFRDLLGDEEYHNPRIILRGSNREVKVEGDTVRVSVKGFSGEIVMSDKCAMTALTNILKNNFSWEVDQLLLAVPGVLNSMFIDKSVVQLVKTKLGKIAYELGREVWNVRTVEDAVELARKTLNEFFTPNYHAVEFVSMVVSSMLAGAVVSKLPTPNITYEGGKLKAELDLTKLPEVITEVFPGVSGGMILTLSLLKTQSTEEGLIFVKKFKQRFAERVSSEIIHSLS